jgi:hypothetical protein
VSAPSTLEKNRVRHSSQYSVCPHPTIFTNAASRNEETKDANNAPKSMNATTWCSRSKLKGPRIDARISAAPTNASNALLMNQHNTMRSGTPPCSSAAIWARNAAHNSNGHERGRASSSTASKIALGGHSADIGWGFRVSANPSLAPR